VLQKSQPLATVAKSCSVCLPVTLQNLIQFSAFFYDHKNDFLTVGGQQLIFYGSLYSLSVSDVNFSAVGWAIIS